MKYVTAMLLGYWLMWFRERFSQGMTSKRLTMYPRVLLFALIALAVLGLLVSGCAPKNPVLTPPLTKPLPVEEGWDGSSAQVMPEPDEAEKERPGDTSWGNQIASPFGACQVYWSRSTAEEEAVCHNLALDAKVKWIRQDFVWQHIEPTRGTFNFSGYDEMVEDALANGFNILGICAPGGDHQYANPWSSGDVSPHTEEQYQDYANFVSALVQRYKGKVMYWEIWNEPDIDEFWRPQPDAVNYTNLLKHAYIAAKEADPSVKIVGLGGVDPGKTEYIRTAFQNGALDYMDVISLHPYGDSPIFERSFQYQNLDVIKNLMSEYDSALPIWATETSYTTYSQGLSEERHAELLVRVYLSLLSQGVETIFWYVLADDPKCAPAEDDSAPHPGLLDSNLLPRKAYYAYKNMAVLLEGYRFSKEYDIGEDGKALLFERSADEQILALWTYGEEIDERGNIISRCEKSVGLTIKGNVRDVIDIYGQSLPSTDASGLVLTIKIDDSPVFIKGSFDVVE